MEARKISWIRAKWNHVGGGRLVGCGKEPCGQAENDEYEVKVGDSTVEYRLGRMQIHG